MDTFPHVNMFLVVVFNVVQMCTDILLLMKKVTLPVESRGY